MNLNIIQEIDPEISDIIVSERQRQFKTIDLIASENIASPAVMSAQATVLTNKYAEGYPGKRYYGGCSCVDAAETLAINRARELFKADYVNVQPHSGSQANMAVYFAMLEPGDICWAWSCRTGDILPMVVPPIFQVNCLNLSTMGFKKTLAASILKK